MGASGMAFGYGLQATSSLVSGINQASAMRERAQYQSDMYNANAKLDELKAEDAEMRGGLAANNVARQTRQRVGAQRAALAAGGVNVNTGSAADIQAATEAVGALDQTAARTNAWREAWGYRIQGANDTTAAKFAKAAGDNEANSTLLAGGLNAAAGFAKLGYALNNLDDLFDEYDYGGVLRGRAGD